MKNLFKSRNFDGHLENFVIDEPELDFTDSNSIYDKNRGCTHIIIKSIDGRERIVSDVEICMSDSPEVTSMFSDEYRARLRSGLVSSRADSSSVSVGDDELIALNIPQGLERDEAAAFVKSRLKSFHRDAVNAVYDASLESSDSSPDNTSSSE